MRNITALITKFGQTSPQKDKPSFGVDSKNEAFVHAPPPRFIQSSFCSSKNMMVPSAADLYSSNAEIMMIDEGTTTVSQDSPPESFEFQNGGTGSGGQLFRNKKSSHYHLEARRKQ